MSKARLVAVVAMARNGVIGRDGEMPWRLATDLQRYRRLTMGKPMIMGRKTLVSIGRVLDGRDSIVMTRSGSLPLEGARIAASAEEALAMAEASAAGRGAEEIVIAGGAEIYRLFLDRMTRLYVTHVDCKPDGDAVFPDIEPASWTAVASEEIPPGPRDNAASRFVTYDRR